MSSTRCSSDPEMESVKPSVDLVTFHNLPPSISDETDIVVRYNLGTAFKSTRLDWVGLFHTEWGTTEDYLAKAYAPFKKRRSKTNNTYEVTFSAQQLKVIQRKNHKLQFVFVSRGNFVAGVSSSFSLTCDNDGDSLSRESSYSLVGSSISSDTQGFENIGDCDCASTSVSDTLETCSGSFAELNIDTPSILPEESSTDNLTGPTKVLMDSTSLVGPFVSFEQRLSSITHPSILWEYMSNKERAIVPFVPLFNVRNSGASPILTQEAVEVTKYKKIPCIKPLLSQHLRPRLELEMMPCCALCAVARSLLEVYRRQLCLRNIEVRDIKLDMTMMRRALELKEEEIRTFLDRELKYNKTEKTIEEVISQMAGLKGDISNLLLQNKHLENQRNKLNQQLELTVSNLQDCQVRCSTAETQLRDSQVRCSTAETQLRDSQVRCSTAETQLRDSQVRCSTAETQLNDILFTLSMKGQSVEFTGMNMNLSDVKGEETHIDGWQMSKNKRSGRLLAIIKQQEKKITELQSNMTENVNEMNNLREELANSTNALQEAKEKVKKQEEELISVKNSLMSSLKREEHTMRMLVNTESEIIQFKNESETREHHLLKSIHELEEQLDANRQVNKDSAMMSFANRLVSTGLATVPDVCKKNWCVPLCPPFVGRNQEQTAPHTLTPQGKEKTDCISWENEAPVAKQPKMSGRKKATKRSHHDGNSVNQKNNPQQVGKEIKKPPKSSKKPPSYQRPVTFPQTCPVCGVSFANAVDSRVVDEHLAFHDIYRV